jgi:hypothetical protein
MTDVNRKYEIAEDKRQRNEGRALMRLTYLMNEGLANGWELMGLSVRKPREEGQDYLITLRALSHDGQPVIAFSGGAGLGDAFVTLVNRLENGSLKWREDEFGR